MPEFEDVRRLVDDLRLCDPDQVSDDDICIVINLALAAGVITTEQAITWKLSTVVESS